MPIRRREISPAIIEAEEKRIAAPIQREMVRRGADPIIARHEARAIANAEVDVEVPKPRPITASMRIGKPIPKVKRPGPNIVIGHMDSPQTADAALDKVLGCKPYFETWFHFYRTRVYVLTQSRINEILPKLLEKGYDVTTHNEDDEQVETWFGGGNGPGSYHYVHKIVPEGKRDFTKMVWLN